MLGCSYAGQVLDSLLAAVYMCYTASPVSMSLIPSRSAVFQNVGPESQVLTLPRNVNYWALPGEELETGVGSRV